MSDPSLPKNIVNPTNAALVANSDRSTRLESASGLTPNSMQINPRRARSRALGLPMPVAPVLGQLRLNRKKRSLTLADASRLTGLNLSQISQIETGRVDPRLSSIQSLAQVLDMALVLVPRSIAAQYQEPTVHGASDSPHTGQVVQSKSPAEPTARVDRLRITNALNRLQR